MIPTGDFFTNLAVELAYDLLRAGAARLQQMAFGSPQEQALHRCYEAAFAGMLNEVAAGLDADRQALVEDILRRFVAEPVVADTLLDLALAGAETLDLPALRRAFNALEFDHATLPVDLDAALTAFQRGLATALLNEAGREGSPLFNRVNLGRVLAVQALLQEQRYTLEDIQQRLVQLETHGGPTVYNIFIHQATGVAIGDMARVEQAFPEDIRQLLREILDALSSLAPPPLRPMSPNSSPPTWTGSSASTAPWNCAASAGPDRHPSRRWRRSMSRCRPKPCRRPNGRRAAACWKTSSGSGWNNGAWTTCPNPNGAACAGAFWPATP
jgi:hypothetical protein